MKLHAGQYPKWQILALNPYQLSDEQIDYFYTRARLEAQDVTPFPPNTIGRMTTAATFLRLLQAQHKERQKNATPPVDKKF